MTPPPPWPPRPLRLGPLLTLGDETDAAGRLLLEDSAPADARRRAERAGVAMVTATCAYPDSPSRQGGELNRSAYDALREELGPMLRGFAWLAGHYLEDHPERRQSPRCLYDVSYLAMHLPIVVFRRAEAPVAPHGALAPWVAAMFKASRGIFSASVNLLNRSGAGGGGEAPLTAAKATAFAEEHGHLVRRQTGRVCAAPTRLIERTLGVMLTGQGADPEGVDLGALVPYEDLWHFHTTHERLNDALGRYRTTLEQAMATAGPDPRTLFATSVVLAGERLSLGAATQRCIEEVSELQTELNDILGRRGRLGPLSFDELTKLL